jgi:hypothetical protein
MDANFRLARKDVSSETKDPGLGNGLAFYGDVLAYMGHVRKHWNQTQDVSSFFFRWALKNLAHA